jgi:hypothetical protein
MALPSIVVDHVSARVEEEEEEEEEEEVVVRASASASGSLPSSAPMAPTRVCGVREPHSS